MEPSATAIHIQLPLRRRNSRDVSVSSKSSSSVISSGSMPKLAPSKRDVQRAPSTRVLDLNSVLQKSDSSLQNSMDFSKPPLPKKKCKSPRVASLRKEMNQYINKGEKLSPQETTNANKSKQNPSIVVVKDARPAPAPTPKQRKSVLSSSNIEAHIAKQQPQEKTVTSEAAPIESPPLRKKSIKGMREMSMRTVLRNKRKLERELSQSNIFHFVLHKVPIDEFQNHENNNKSRQSSSKDGKSRNQDKMPLGRFLLMKQESERQVLKKQIEDDGDTWQMESVQFSHQNDGTVAEPRVVSREEAEEAAEDNDATIITEIYEGENESDDDDDDDDDAASVASLDVMDLDGKPRQYHRDDCSSSLSEDLESQTLSLSLDDMCAEPDEAHDAVDTNQEYVKDFAVKDPAGRKCSYTGYISKSSRKPCGRGRLEYLDKGEIFDGQFVHGFWTGFGRCTYANGDAYKGFFQNDVRHGHGVMKYADGRKFDGTYANGMKVEGMMKYQDGSSYVGQWNRGARHGRGTYKFSNGSVFYGEFKEDTIEGTGVLTWPNGGRYIGEWRRGVRHGSGREFSPDGSIRCEGRWENGRFEKKSS